eukprot:m.139739 g.139739  ORF g.139739 m.139739 type:complete len:961 (+) comp9619_c0_seq3:1010-3892(+)
MPLLRVGTAPALLVGHRSYRPSGTSKFRGSPYVAMTRIARRPLDPALVSHCDRGPPPRMAAPTPDPEVVRARAILEGLPASPDRLRMLPLLVDFPIAVTEEQARLAIERLRQTSQGVQLHLQLPGRTGLRDARFVQPLAVVQDLLLSAFFWKEASPAATDPAARMIRARALNVVVSEFVCPVLGWFWSDCEEILGFRNPAESHTNIRFRGSPLLRVCCQGCNNTRGKRAEHVHVASLAELVKRAVTQIFDPTPPPLKWIHMDKSDPPGPPVVDAVRECIFQCFSIDYGIFEIIPTAKALAENIDCWSSQLRLPDSVFSQEKMNGTPRAEALYRWHAMRRCMQDVARLVCENSHLTGFRVTTVHEYIHPMLPLHEPLPVGTLHEAAKAEAAAHTCQRTDFPCVSLGPHSPLHCLQVDVDNYPSIVRRMLGKPHPDGSDIGCWALRSLYRLVHVPPVLDGDPIGEGPIKRVTDAILTACQLSRAQILSELGFFRTARDYSAAQHELRERLRNRSALLQTHGLHMFQLSASAQHSLTLLEGEIRCFRALIIEWLSVLPNILVANQFLCSFYDGTGVGGCPSLPLGLCGCCGKQSGHPNPGIPDALPCMSFLREDPTTGVRFWDVPCRQFEQVMQFRRPEVRGRREPASGPTASTTRGDLNVNRVLWFTMHSASLTASTISQQLFNDDSLLAEVNDIWASSTADLAASAGRLPFDLHCGWLVQHTPQEADLLAEKVVGLVARVPNQMDESISAPVPMTQSRSSSPGSQGAISVSDLLNLDDLFGLNWPPMGPATSPPAVGLPPWSAAATQIPSPSFGASALDSITSPGLEVAQAPTSPGLEVAQALPDADCTPPGSRPLSQEVNAPKPVDAEGEIRLRHLHDNLASFSLFPREITDLVRFMYGDSGVEVRQRDGQPVEVPHRDLALQLMAYVACHRGEITVPCKDSMSDFVHLLQLSWDWHCRS